MALFTNVLWALSLLLMWTTPCESELVTIKMTNVTRDLDIVQTRVSELSAEYKNLEGVCEIWPDKKGTPKPKSCVEVKEIQSESVVATIYPADDDTPLQVYCDQDTDGGGWTVFQRRHSGPVDFNRNWTEYQNGFGDLNDEFWLGLDALHMLTSRQQHELRVDLKIWYGENIYATYSNFSINNSSDKYRLNFGNFTGGSAGNGLFFDRGQQFSTWDNDHHGASSESCAYDWHGGWWYRKCQITNLNGEYKLRTHYEGVRWSTYELTYPMELTEMKIRPTTL